MTRERSPLTNRLCARFVRVNNINNDNFLSPFSSGLLLTVASVPLRRSLRLATPARLPSIGSLSSASLSDLTPLPSPSPSRLSFSSPCDYSSVPDSPPPPASMALDVPDMLCMF